MINVSIARRYARALLSVALDMDKADTVSVDLKKVVEIHRNSPEIRELFRNPGFSHTQRHDFIDSFSKKAGMDEISQSFLKLLIDRNRTGHIEQIARIYEELADESANRLKALVQTSAPLDSKSRDKLSSALSELTGKTIIIEETTEPSLLGGLVTRVGDRVFDGSLRTQLKSMRKSVITE